jgi:predicted acylesterase/phospholipase RssA
MDQDPLQPIRRAQGFIAGTSPLTDDQQLRDLVRDLKSAQEWWWARRVLQRSKQTPGPPVDLGWIHEQIALCTYKDTDLRRHDALRSAWISLFGDERREPESVASAEQAGLAGAMAKRRWELDGADSNLRQAIRWYDRCADINRQAQQPADGFDPYGHVNAAFVRDLLAHAQEPTGAVTQQYIAALHQEATALRNEVLEHTVPDNWWRLVSRVEALVGLGRVSEAQQELTDRPDLVSPASEWERQSTAGQLLSLAEIRLSPDDVRSVQALLASILDLDPPADRRVATLNRRFGLAMSGGGFRASLFHLGVLARLADEGLLRQVEVLSTVSGGSIAGAAYFASLAQVLSREGDPTDDGARDLQNMIDHFVGEVSGKSFRMRALFNPRLAIRPGGRTARLGRLIEARLLEPQRSDERRRDLRWLNVVPAKERPDFSPHRDNWRRRTKVPVLLLNATSLGTGRPWRFTGTWMGEPIQLSASRADPVTRLDPIWYDRVPGAQARLTIGEAVAASAAVPGLFPPIRMHRLYERRSVTLVDGGVYDNQGITGLLNRDCTDLFVSDASGLFDDRRKPARWIPSVLLRTNAILMATVRLTSVANLSEAATSGQVRDCRSIYLLQDIRPEQEPPLGLDDGAVDPVDVVVTTAPSHPVDPGVQRALAELRTDLDRFTEAECFSLMELGYRLSSRALEETPHPLANRRVVAFPWSFRVAGHWMVPDSERAARLTEALRRGRPLFLKWCPGRRRNITRLTASRKRSAS